MTIDEAIEQAKYGVRCDQCNLFLGDNHWHRGHKHVAPEWLTVLIDAATANAPSKEGL